MSLRFVFKKKKKGDSPKLADENKQCEKTKSIENSCPVQSNIFFALLQPAVVVVKNPKDSKELKTKDFFDNGSQRSYVSNRAVNFLNISSKSLENICISTLGNNKLSNQIANVVAVQLKSKVEESIHLKVLSVPFICISLKNQPFKSHKKSSKICEKFVLLSWVRIMILI